MNLRTKKSHSKLSKEFQTVILTHRLVNSITHLEQESEKILNVA
jgi:hypothetical protein